MSTLQGEAVLFGFPSTPAAATIQPRAKGWRFSGAAWILAGTLVLAPLAAVVPPHAPWAMGVLVAGFVLARRRWTETHTVMTVDGTCPKCGGAFQVKPSRLKRPHPLECEHCHHVSALKLPDDQLQ